MPTIVTIDGPAGAGKSTVAKMLSDRLGLPVLDSGSLFRAAGWKALRDGVNIDDPVACGQLVESTVIKILGPGKVAVDGSDVSGEIRSPQVTDAASRIGVHLLVQEALIRIQRRYAAVHGCVVEGRNTGTASFPQATVKVFLTADPEVRYQRVADSRGEEVARLNAERDSREASRNVLPMVPPVDALIVDSTDLTLGQVVELIEGFVRNKQLRG